MYFLAFSTLAAIIGVFFGIFLAHRISLRAARQRLNYGTIPMLYIRRGRRAAAWWRRLFHGPGKKAAAITAPAPPPRRRWRLVAVVAVVVLVAGGGGLFIYNGNNAQALAESAVTVEIAVQLPITGKNASFGGPAYEGMQLAIDEANASGTGPRFILTPYDDRSSNELARDLADEIVESEALLVLGPALNATLLKTGEVYSTTNMATISPSIASDLLREGPTTFRTIFKNSDQGEMLATYLVRVLNQKRAAVFVIDTPYGKSLRDGFELTATKLELDADYYPFTNRIEAEQLAGQVALDPEQPAIVLLTPAPEGLRILTTLRRQGVTGPFIGGDVFGDANLNDQLAREPEEKEQPGIFTDNLYGLAPMILDSASSDILAFADRYQTQFGHDPTWVSVSGYDAANLAIAAVRAALADPAISGDLEAQRVAVLNYLYGLNSPEKALPGLAGPLWFDETRARPQAIRVGRFYGGRFESAPTQIVAVSEPDPVDLSTGAVFEIRPERYARLQRVVYTGVFLKELTSLNPARSSFNADFYLWLRFTGRVGSGTFNPTALSLPTMLSGNFTPAEPLQRQTLEDGSDYWLWRVQAEFSNDFDLRLYPFDQQSLSLAIFNTTAPEEQIVYAVDRRPPPEDVVLEETDDKPTARAKPAPTPPAYTIVSPAAFRNLSELQPLDISLRSESLIAETPPSESSGGESGTPLKTSGVAVMVELQRLALPTLSRTMLPLLIMAMILLVSLYLPWSLRGVRLFVAISGVLAAALLLTSINNQLAVNYTITIVYAFYVFFALALLSIISVFSSGRLRARRSTLVATRIESGTRIVFIITVIATVVMITLFPWR